jgi:hypothetical protein
MRLRAQSSCEAAGGPRFASFKSRLIISDDSEGTSRKSTLDLVEIYRVDHGLRFLFRDGHDLVAVVHLRDEDHLQRLGALAGVVFFAGVALGLLAAAIARWVLA